MLIIWLCVILSVSLLSGIPGTCLRAETTPDMKALFSSAQASFEQGLTLQGEQKREMMIKAAGQFQSLIRDHHIENGNLYYNMGNAYFEAGEIGKAILSYRQAEKLLPGVSDLQYNLNQARSRLNLPEPTKSWWENIVKGFFFWHYMITYELRRSLFFAVFSLFWVVLAVMIIKRHIFLRAGLIILIGLNIAFGGSFLLSYHQLHFIHAGVVIKENTIARKGPGTSYESFYQKPLPAGTEFVISEKHEIWWKIKLPVGDEMWIQGNDAELI
ncbi:MAG: hypothetical protein ABIK68_09485 [bacterium]